MIRNGCRGECVRDTKEKGKDAEGILPFLFSGHSSLFPV